MYYADFAKDPITEAMDKVNYVVHLGGKTMVDFSIRDPEPFIESNVVGTYKILEEIRRNKSTIKKGLVFSTDEVLGSITTGSYKEDARLNPSNPYSSTKACSEMLTLGYKNTYDLPLVISRAENVYGYYQGAEKMLPVSIKRATAGENILVYGTGKNVRQWIFIDDVCTAIVKLLEAGVPGETYNIAGNRELTNLELAHRILNAMRLPLDKISFIPDHEIRPGHDFRYALNNEKIKSLGWEPRVDLDEGIAKVVKWYTSEEGKKWTSV